MEQLAGVLYRPNRTTVGLKERAHQPEDFEAPCPNRTTVGLKGGLTGVGSGAMIVSQSHHSGIESMRVVAAALYDTAVPIAPQWD